MCVVLHLTDNNSRHRQLLAETWDRKRQLLAETWDRKRQLHKSMVWLLPRYGTKQAQATAFLFLLLHFQSTCPPTCPTIIGSKRVGYYCTWTHYIRTIPYVNQPNF